MGPRMKNQKRRKGNRGCRSALVLGSAMAVLLLLLSSGSTAYAQQANELKSAEHEVEPGAGDDEFPSFPEMAPIDDATRVTSSGDQQGWEDRATPTSPEEEIEEGVVRRDDVVESRARLGVEASAAEEVLSEGGAHHTPLPQEAASSSSSPSVAVGNAGADTEVAGSNIDLGSSAEEQEHGGMHVSTGKQASSAAAAAVHDEAEDSISPQERGWSGGALDRQGEKEAALGIELELGDMEAAWASAHATTSPSAGGSGGDVDGIGGSEEQGPRASENDGGDSGSSSTELDDATDGSGVDGGSAATGGDDTAAATAADERLSSPDADLNASDPRTHDLPAVPSADVRNTDDILQADSTATASRDGGEDTSTVSTVDAGIDSTPDPQAHSSPGGGGEQRRLKTRTILAGEENGDSGWDAGEGDPSVEPALNGAHGAPTGSEANDPETEGAGFGPGGSVGKDSSGSRAEQVNGRHGEVGTAPGGERTPESRYSGSGGGGDGGWTDGRARQGRGSPELAQRVRDVEAELLRKLLAEEDAKSLLDIWVEKARDFILTRTVPPTDADCDFNWSRLRCEPKCSCGVHLRFGDYTPGRSCRLLYRWERSPDCEDIKDPSDEPAIKRLAEGVAWALGGAKRAYDARIAPPSDEECSFDFGTRRCEPQPLCRLRFRWGDLTPSRACRLAQDEEPAHSQPSKTFSFQ